jgi:hypothetical protein
MVPSRSGFSIRPALGSGHHVLAVVIALGLVALVVWALLPLRDLRSK